MLSDLFEELSIKKLNEEIVNRTNSITKSLDDIKKYRKRHFKIIF